MVKSKVSKGAAVKVAPSEAAPQGRRFDDAQKQHALVLVVVLDGVMELRFCGARVQLGPLMT